MKSLVVLNECMFSEEQKKLLKKKFTDTAFYTDTSSEEQAIKRIGQRNIIIMDQFFFSFSEKLLKECTGLELVIVNTTAYDNIDLPLLKKYGVRLSNVGEYATQDVAEVALAMVASLNTHQQTGQQIVVGKPVGLLYKSHEKVSDIWPGHPITPFIKRKQLRHQTIGIVGLGKIGRRCAEMFRSLGLSVIGYNRTKKYIDGIKLVSLRKLFTKSDTILITLAYTKKKMDGFISADLFKRSKKEALLVSIAHPNLLDMAYLIDNPNAFRGIGFDYLVTDEVLHLLQVRKHNIIVTPHLGSQSDEAIMHMTTSMIEAAERFAEGNPFSFVL